MNTTEGNFTPTPNIIMDALLTTDLTSSEQKIISFIIRFGYGVYQQDSVTLQQWNDLCVCGIDKTNIKRMLLGLEAKKIININWKTKTVSIQDDTIQWVGRRDMTTKIKEILHYTLKSNQVGVGNPTTDSCMATNSDVDKSCMATNSNPCEISNDVNNDVPKEKDLNKDIKKEHHHINNIYIKEQGNLIDVVRNVIGSCEMCSETQLQLWDSYVDDIEKYEETIIKEAIIIFKELVRKKEFKNKRIESSLKFIANTVINLNKKEKVKDLEDNEITDLSTIDTSTIDDYNAKRMSLKNIANAKWSGKHPIETLKDAGDLVKIFPNLTITDWQSIFGELSNKKPASWQDLKEDVQNALDKKGKI